MTTLLSASKIKTAQGCSWRYASSYLWHIPERKNSGASRGSCIHVVLEALANPKRRNYVEKILKKNDPFCIKGVKHLTYKHAHLEDVSGDDDIEKIKESILNGLKSDFYGEERGLPTQTFTEKDFLLESESYKARGFIDRLFIYKDGSALIRDYKSSKQTYQGEDASNSGIQATIYALAVKTLFPEVTNISVEFFFLKFDCSIESEWKTGIYQGRETKKLYHNGGGRIRLHYSTDELDGFEHYLAGIQKYLDAFTDKHASENFAATKGRPTDDTFSCNMLCGFDSKQGELKKDGSLKFSCPFKWAMNYYFITKDDKWIASCFLDEREKLLAKYPIDLFQWEEREYGGCKFWQK